MSNLEQFFTGDKRGYQDHPMMRLYSAQKQRADFGRAVLQIQRPRAALGFQPARMTLNFFNDQGQLYDYKTEEWDPTLNSNLIDAGIRAEDELNEVQRFGLGLAAAFDGPESRYGDGFFNSVLMRFIDSGPFATKEPVQALRPYISTNRPYDRGTSADDCTAMIQDALQDRWLELRRNLGYDEDAADRILAGALAYYLDERFSITDGRKLGWLREPA